MIVKVFLGWVIKIVTGSILATVSLIIINGMPDVPIEKVIFILMAAGGIVLLPVLTTLLVLANMHKYRATRTILRKLVKGYLVTYLITLGFGNILVFLLWGDKHIVLPILNFSIVMLCFGMGALLAWALIFRNVWKTSPEEDLAQHPEVIDDL